MLNERKGLLAMLFLGLACGLWAGYRLAPRPQIERQETVAVKEDNRKVETVTVTRVIREPSGKVEIVREEKKAAVVNKHTAQLTESSKVVNSASKHRLSASINPLDRSEFDVRYGHRIMGPVWIEGGVSRLRMDWAVLVGIGVEW